MKNILIIIVLTLFLKPIFPVLDYVVNYNYISKVLCENKAKPVLKCNGKCHLMKQLAKASEGENNDSKDKKTSSSEFEILFFEKALELKITKPTYFLNKKVNANYHDLYVYQNVASFFHPPTV